MYAFPEMLDATNQKWPSDAHRQVAESCLICNPHYFTMTDLCEGARIIAAIAEAEIKLVTPAQIIEMGVML